MQRRARRKAGAVVRLMKVIVTYLRGTDAMHLHLLAPVVLLGHQLNDDMRNTRKQYLGVRGGG